MKKKTLSIIQGSVECDLCLEVVEYLDTLLEDNATEEMINETLLRLCSGLPFGALQDIVRACNSTLLKHAQGSSIDILKETYC